MVDTQFTRDLDMVIQGGLVLRDDGMLNIPLIVNGKFEKMTIYDYEGTTRVNNALKRLAAARSDKEMSLSDMIVLLSKTKKVTNIGVDTLKAVKMELYSIMYDTLTPREKGLFWCDFWAFNNPKLVKAALV